MVSGLMWGLQYFNHFVNHEEFKKLPFVYYSWVYYFNDVFDLIMPWLHRTLSGISLCCPVFLCKNVYLSFFPSTMTSEILPQLHFLQGLL